MTADENGAPAGQLRAPLEDQHADGDGSFLILAQGRTGRWSKLWRAANAKARADNAARRTRVLAHEDLREALTLPPLNYARPDQWTGYVPPRLDPEEACEHCPTWRCRHVEHLARPNTSARRRALVAIAAEALRRDATAAEKAEEE